MRGQRVLKMGFGEITGRSRQGALKWLERMGASGKGNEEPRAIFKELASRADLFGIQTRVQDRDLHGTAGALLDRFRDLAPSRFFEGVASEAMPEILKEHMASACDDAISAAERVRQGRFHLLGYSSLYFGDPIDWHLDPISGRRAPLVHWSRLNPLDAGRVGDSKIIWELNRHQWLIHLGEAYQLTGNERYAETFARAIREWIEKNPPGIGINWASSLEVALRLISWCWALFLFRGAKELSPDLFLSVLEGISAHAKHVEKYLSYFFSPNTHLTGEALGLFYAGSLFPELRSAGRWRALGARILKEQMGRQILPDGVYFEQSTCYQRYTVEIYLHLLILARRNGLTLPNAVEERIQKMLDFLLFLRRPDGSMPQIGDHDGGWLLPLVARDPGDFRPVFSTAAVLFGRPDYAWAAGELAPETLWLLGPTAVESYEALRPSSPASKSFDLFPEGGYAVMRSGWDEGAHQLIFDVGPLGCSISGGHGHADLLSIQCAVFGKPYIIDPGTYCYTADTGWRDFFRCAAAHSSVVVDGAEPAVPAGAFAWKSRPSAHLRRSLSTEAFDLADADHDAYGSLPDPVQHRRRVIFVKPRYWIVVDDLTGQAEHRVELRFQFAPMEVALEPELWSRARRSEDDALLIKAFATVPLERRVVQGSLAPMEGWVSPNYGRRQPAPVLIYSAADRLPLRILSLLLPVKDPLVPVPGVSMLVDDNLLPIGLAFEGGENVLIAENAIILAGD